jgi:hypothetical protein
VAKAADTDDADLLARPDVPVAQRRPSGDAGAEQRRDGGELFGAWRTWSTKPSLTTIAWL